MRNKSTIHVCVFGGLILFIVQLVLLAVLLYAPSSNKNDAVSLKDIELLVNITSRLQLPFILADPVILQRYANYKHSLHDFCMFCDYRHPLTFILQFRGAKSNYEFLSLLEGYNFFLKVFYFGNSKSSESPVDIPKNAPISFIIKRNTLIHIVVFHERAGNFWWHGSISTDTGADEKLSETGLTPNSLYMMNKEGAYDKFEVSHITANTITFLIPKDVSEFLRERDKSHFVECSYKRTNEFLLTYGRDTSSNSKRFEHRVWKLLAKTKTILDKLNVEFWISSGTCLGYFRQCGIIPWSKDLDIGIYIADYNENMLSEFLVHGFTLKHWFGRINDSLEISFLSGDIKLDIFFFYEDGEWTWNGGTQAKTGKKFKYIFPQFTLCWTQFLELKVRVPCQTQQYIEANYGPNWFNPVIDWDWKSSPPNVRDNGMWPKEEWAHVIKVY